MAINGNQYAWEDIQVVMQALRNAPIEGITEIKYSSEKNHTVIYGRGSDPVSLGRGQKKYEASMTILQDELEALQASLPAGKDITDIPAFTITVAYAPEGGVQVVDQLTNVRIKKVEKAFKNEDDHMSVPLELVVGKINFNI
jgi:hypothetical protein